MTISYELETDPTIDGSEADYVVAPVRLLEDGSVVVPVKFVDGDRVEWDTVAEAVEQTSWRKEPEPEPEPEREVAPKQKPT